MTPRVPPDRYPWWVKFSLLGARTRTSQWFWVGASLLATFVCIALGLRETGVLRIVLALSGAWGLLAAGLYLATIRWVDRHGHWG